MRMSLRPSESPSDLVGIIHQVRRRWRSKLMLRGAVGVLGLGVAALILSAWGLESWRFSPNSIVTFRIVMALALAGLVGWFLVRPLLWRVSDEQVALYLEEHEPSLQAEIISAIEASRLVGTEGSPHSAVLVRRLIESAVAKCEAIDWGKNLERRPVRRYAVTFAVVAIAAVTLFSLGPRFLRHGLSALLIVSRSVQAAAPYRIDVSPGNATVPRGVDQTITATLDGFETDQASLMIRKSADAPFERLPLVRSEKNAQGNQYEGMLFDLAGPIDYFVEAAGVKSPTFSLKVVDLPYVDRLELELHFPAYTGLAPRKIEDGGDLAVLKGTEVRAKVTPTMKALGGLILLHDTSKLPLAVAEDGSLTGRFTADRDGFYRFELDAPTGEHVTASPQYTIDVLSDQSPTVSISKPGRDTNASPIEEVFIEARAEDDFGVRDLDLVYSVNGGPEKTVRLFDGKNRLAEVTAGHTLYLEELDVEPGDFVSYYARGADNDAGGGKRQSSDMYFLQVRPLRKEFRRAESDAGAGGGGRGGGGQVGALSQQQRQIIAATFNVNRDRKTMSADKVRENSTVIALSQAKLREQVDGLLTRMNSRLIQQDPSFKKIADLLPQAVTEMKNAEAKLQKVDPQGALEPEQKALQVLQKAEEEYEVQVQMGRQGGGGGGGGQSAMAEDLADLFELELDKMANQYETAQRAQQEQADQQVDALLEKLKELARRQEQEAERQRRRAQAGQQGGGGGGDQQALADQIEEAARRLEQLSRQENRPELGDTARELRQAANAMRQAAANGQSGAAQAATALDRLQDAQRRLQQSQAGRAERDIKDAQRQAEEIAREQQQIAEGVRGLDTAGDSRQEKVQQLSERKDQLESKVAGLEKQVERTAGDIARSEREASRKLGEASQSMRENRLRDKIRYSRSMIRAGVQGSDASNFEQEIGNNVAEMQKKIGEAAAALGRTKPDTTAGALDKARDLARGMESLDQRMRERSGRDGQSQQQGEQGQQGREGQQGQQGRQGQKGQQGQQGQQAQGQGQAGQQGQQGRQGQEGQQGQQGQHGQGGQQGQQGQDGQGGRGGLNENGRTTGGRDGAGLTFGNAPFSGAGPGDSRPGGFTPEDVRQFRGELRRWTRDAEALRRMLQAQKIDAKEIDALLRNLRQLDDDRVYQDVEELARLQSQVTDSAKRIEYDLRRKLEGVDSQILVSGSDEVPEQFRKVVEQYYRSLSKAPEPPKTPDKKDKP
jgi:outer membrane murein-binding lipoprotein Lpp